MSLLTCIGNTPLVALDRINPNPAVRIYAKMEGHNPGGSVKDRAALGMLQGAMDRGEIKAGSKLVEATSGNTGIALAMIANVMGLKMSLVMPDNATQERVDTMKAFGAELILTPSSEGIEYSRNLAQEMATKQGYYQLNQFANPDNWKMHFRTTGPEIWRDTQGEITHFVSAMGTTGTIMGVSRYLKQQRQDVQIIGAQPDDNASIPGIRKWPEAYLPKIFEAERVDQIKEVSEAEAKDTARRLAKEEAIFTGMSGGGACAIALKIAAEMEQGVIVFIACDRGDRYLSSGLFGA